MSLTQHFCLGGGAALGVADVKVTLLPCDRVICPVSNGSMCRLCCKAFSVVAQPQKNNWKVKFTFVSYLRELGSLILVTEKKNCFVSESFNVNGINLHLNTSDFLLFFMGLNLPNLSCVSLIFYIRDSRPADVTSCRVLKSKLERIMEHQGNRQRLWWFKEI